MPTMRFRTSQMPISGNSVRFRPLRKQGRPAQNQFSPLPISDVSRSDIDLSENGADLSRIRFRFLRVPIFPVSDSDLSRDRTDLSRIRFPSCQKQGRPAQNQIPASPNPNFPESAHDLSGTRGRSVQNQISIRPHTRPVLRPGRFFSGASAFAAAPRIPMRAFVGER